MNCVASSLPGRIRLRHAALRNPERLARLQRTIRDWPPVRAVSVNERAGSLLVSYDAFALREDECARRCIAALAGVLPARTEAPTGRATAAPAANGTPPRAPARSGAPRVRANRLAKRAMLATLAASMLLAAMGAKRWHIWTGIAFLHALGVHLWVHRRNLLR